MHRTGCRFAITTIRVPTSYDTTKTAYEFLCCQSSCTCFVCMQHTQAQFHTIMCTQFHVYKPRSGKNKSSTIFYWHHHWISSHRVKHTSHDGDDKSENFYIARTTQTEHPIYLFYISFFEKLINFYRFERIQKKFHIRCDQRIWKGVPEMAQENTNIEKSIIEWRHRQALRQWATEVTAERQREANKFINKINLSSIYWQRCASETR